jgi:hypothetical protein
MAEGFIHSESSVKWLSGVMPKGFIEGLRYKKDRTMLPITAMRCPRCGFLEVYAPAKAERKR